ncbi:MAG: LysR substrate-binding domain-containing protein [Actinomycetota bacterium]|nr:LysR substrate-binding domain-containing protein [Actinomycetota bacterium]
MELRQLEYFVAVAEEQSFTRAAERVHISQSGISAQLRQLERDLGAELIDRSTRTATLTAAGRAALEHARSTLAQAGGIRDAVNAITGLVRGRVTVGMVTGCTLTPLFDAVADFRHDHPGVELELLEDGSEYLAERLRAGNLDVAVLGSATASLPGLESRELVAEPLIALAPREHPLAKADQPIRLAELVEHPLLCMPPGTGIRATLDRACDRAGLRPKIAVEATAPAALRDLATRGLGIAVLSRSMLTTEPKLTALEIPELQTPGYLLLAWRPTPSPAAEAMLHRCLQRFEHTNPRSA